MPAWTSERLAGVKAGVVDSLVAVMNRCVQPTQGAGRWGLAVVVRRRSVFRCHGHGRTCLCTEASHQNGACRNLVCRGAKSFHRLLEPYPMPHAPRSPRRSPYGAAAAARPRVGPDPATVQTIVEMGFSQARAEEALRRVGANSVELAMEWLIAHPEAAAPAAGMGALQSVPASGFCWLPLLPCRRRALLLLKKSACCASIRHPYTATSYVCLHIDCRRRPRRGCTAQRGR